MSLPNVESPTYDRRSHSAGFGGAPTIDGGLELKRFIIAIDFGTTYSGVAFALVEGNNVKLSDIDIVQDWGDKLDNQAKIQSVISYSDRHETAGWGNSLARDAVVMKHMKLKLDIQSVSEELNFLLQALDGMSDLSFDAVKNAKGMPEYPDKSPEEIVTDYLEKLFEPVKENIKDVVSDYSLSRMPTDIVITVPVDWSSIAHNATYRAISKAGFNKQTFPNLQDVVFVTEPEAAAMYTSRFYEEKNEQFLKVGECFILCDAGGGTVDLVSYKVKSLKPLTLERVGKPIGRKCGSIFIDYSFRQWLRYQLGEEHYRILDPLANFNKAYGIEGGAMRQVMAEFEGLKLNFSHAVQDDLYFDLPEKPLNDLTIPGKVDKGQMTIPNKHMQEFFQRCIDDIVTMVKVNIRAVEKAGSRVKNLFLVGGFGESAFLQEELVKGLQMRGDIKLRIPDTSWTAVVRGAVICGVEKDSINGAHKTRVCPKYYGIAIDESFSYEHDERDRRENAVSGKLMAIGQMRWLLKKGDVILDNEPTEAKHDFQLYFKDTDLSKRAGMVTIYTYAEDYDLPTRLQNARDEMHEEMHLNFDLREVSMTEFERKRSNTNHYDPSQDYYSTTITLRLRLSGEGLEAKLFWKGEDITQQGNLRRGNTVGGDNYTRRRNSWEREGEPEFLL